MKAKHIMLVMMVVLAVCGCAKDNKLDIHAVHHEDDGDMTFNAELLAGPVTRSDATSCDVTVPGGVKRQAEAFLRPMAGAMMSYDVESADPVTRGEPANTMYPSFSFVANGISETVARLADNGKYYADGGARFSDMPTESAFFCWGPLEAPGVSYNETTGKLLYETPEDVTNQKDLLVSRSAVISPSNMSPVRLTFKHALAGIQVKASEIFPDCTVNSVVLKNVYTKGSYDPETEEWTLDTSSLGDVELVPEAINGITAESAIADGAHTAMLIPQELTSDAELVITLTVHHYEYTETPTPVTYRFGHVLPASLPAGTIFDFSLNGRRMFLFEGTATGPFVVKQNGIQQATLMTIEPDASGHFSVLLPTPYKRQNSGYHFWGENVLTSIETLPEYLSSLSNWSEMFMNCKALTTLPDYFPAGPIVTSTWRMFSGCEKMENVGAFDLPINESVSEMFFNCKALKEVDLGDIPTVTTMRACFQNCNSLERVTVTGTENVTSYWTCFGECHKLEECPAGLDFSSATNCYRVFINCRSITEIPASYDLSTATDLSGMFQGCSSLVTVPSLNLSSAVWMASMFQGCSSIVTIPTITTSDALTTIASAFQNCSKLTSVDLTETKNVTSFRSSFDGCKALVACPDGLDFSSATDCYRTFWECRTITAIPDHYDLSNATSGNGMFGNCTSLVTVPSLDFSSATTIGSLFYNCTSVVTIPTITTTDVLTDMSWTFSGCKLLRTTNLTNTQNVKNYQYAFSGCYVLEAIPSGVEFTSATNCNRTFLDCKAITEIPARCDFSNVTGASLMFSNCTSLVTVPVLDFSSAVYLDGLFSGCTAVATIPEIKTSSALTTLKNAFNRCTSLVTLSLTDASSVTDMTIAFNGDTALANLSGFSGLAVSTSFPDSNALTHDSLVGLIGNLATVSGKTLSIGATNLAKLSAAEIQVGTDKGWTIQ